MSELMAQFVLESRDLVEQATAGLAALEQSQQDRECLDATFRAIHTLKGGAAIVEFHAMERAVHAAEEVMSRARSGECALTGSVIGECLACLDQVVRWLDVIERAGDLPEHANAEADRIVARLGSGEARKRTTALTETWVEELLGRNPDERTRARTAVRFTAYAGSFFQGEDPIGRFAALPQLLSFEMDASAGWPALTELDPFESILVLQALAGCPASVVREQFKNCSGDCEILALSADEQVDAQRALPEAALAILQAQIALLENLEARGFAGRVASAGQVAASVLQHCGEALASERIAQAAQRGLDANDVRHLREAIANSMVSNPSTPALAPDTPAHRVDWVRTLRVDAARIDALVRLTGELTVMKNALGHAANLAVAEHNSLAGSLQDQHGKLEHLVSELQRAVLGIRVLPLRTVLQRLPALVREMSARLDKPVKLAIQGDETEADKAIVEMLFEPLLHVVRNALDHGIESPDVRAQRNKPPLATIRIRALREGGHVHIEVHDDGGGIDVSRVRAVARERGIISASRLDGMSDAEVIDMVFAPGFSTAAKITAVSGRGVGMDAVRAAVERVGGRVSIETDAAQGTTVRFMLPFSVMLTHVLTVEAGGQMFGIPLDGVVETMRVPAASIVGVGAASAMVRRDRTIPVFELAGLLGVSSAKVAASEASEAIVVVAAVAGHLGGIRVDRLGERMEVMLEPLEGLLAGVPGITGTSILGDGRVLLVLDLVGVLQ